MVTYVDEKKRYGATKEAGFITENTTMNTCFFERQAENEAILLVGPFK